MTIITEKKILGCLVLRNYRAHRMRSVRVSAAAAHPAILSTNHHRQTKNEPWNRFRGINYSSGSGRHDTPALYN